MGDGVVPGPGWGVEGTRPGADKSRPALWLKNLKTALGVSRGGPWGGPGGVSVGPWGASRGGPGAPPGGYPRGAPWWPPSLRTILPFWSRPPGGAPRGGPRGAIFGGSGLAGGKIKLSPV